MSNAFSVYVEAQEHTRRMMAEYNSAQRGLELAQILKRAAEVRSQAEPLRLLLVKLGVPPAERDQARVLLCRLVAFVSHGRAMEEE